MFLLILPTVLINFNILGNSPTEKIWEINYSLFVLRLKASQYRKKITCE